MDPGIVGAIIGAAVAFAVSLIGLRGRLKKARLEIEQLEHENRQQKSVIDEPTLEQIRAVDQNLQHLESALEFKSLLGHPTLPMSDADASAGGDLLNRLVAEIREQIRKIIQSSGSN